MFHVERDKYEKYVKFASDPRIQTFDTHTEYTHSEENHLFCNIAYPVIMHVSIYLKATLMNAVSMGINICIIDRMLCAKQMDFALFYI